MGKVLIIKNNDMNSKIHKYAEESYNLGQKRFYNTVEGTDNNNAVKNIKTNFKSDGLVLMISYENQDSNDIKDIFIGENVNINENYNVEYVMKVYLTSKYHHRTIKSIIDKIDLDISADFERECYVIMSDMESLYQELYERIIAQNNIQLVKKENVEEKIEEPYQLNLLAQTDSQSIRVYPSDNVGEFRTEFQRDRERVVNCKAFRRLVDKAQIFGAEKGDYYRTRMTHSLEVNQIAKAIAYALNLNLDLTEAIALGHDLGHTPFGHQGERTLDDILSGKIDVGIPETENIFKMRCYGGFKHNYQSARILTELEEKYVDFSGLNVSVQVIEGVLKHTKLKPKEIRLDDFLSEKYLEKINIDYDSEKQICSSLEGQVVAIADEIAQRGHDVDDALTSDVMSIEDFMDRLKISKCNKLYEKIVDEIEKIDNSNRLTVDKKELKIARIVSSIINYFIEATINNSRKNIQNNQHMNKLELSNITQIIEFSPEVEKVNSYLERVVQKKVICNNEVARADHNASMIVRKLFETYYKNPRLLHEGTIHKIFIQMLKHENKLVSNSAINLSDGGIKIVNEEIKEITTTKLNENIVLKYLENSDDNCTEEDVVIFEKRRILIRAITDYIAGMTDGYALEEYEKLK